MGQYLAETKTGKKQKKCAKLIGMAQSS